MQSDKLGARPPFEENLSVLCKDLLLMKPNKGMQGATCHPVHRHASLRKPLPKLGCKLVPDYPLSASLIEPNERDRKEKFLAIEASISSYLPGIGMFPVYVGGMHT